MANKQTFRETSVPSLSGSWLHSFQNFFFRAGNIRQHNT